MVLEDLRIQILDCADWNLEPILDHLATLYVFVSSYHNEDASTLPF